jgi:hypothetical protein
MATGHVRKGWEKLIKMMHFKKKSGDHPGKNCDFMDFEKEKCGCQHLPWG